jgi:CheY-like chemotaxis protein
VLADESRLQQVLFNLIGNAIKFTPKGEILIQVEMVEKEKVQLRVKDTGLGIDLSESEEIFEAFHQGKQQGNTINGHGLGLTITRNLLRLHQSELKVKSIPGHGSTFYFDLDTATHLPLSVQEITRRDVQTANQDASDFIANHALQDKPDIPQESHERRLFHRARPDHASEQKAHPFMIWAVDDEPVNLQIIENQLTLFGYQCRSFTLGHHLLDALEKEEQPDLILLDIMMPGINGLEVCKVIRQHYSPLELPVIMLTARQQISDIVQAFEAGASDYLAKPYDQAELKVRVEAQIHVGLSHQLFLNNEQLMAEIAQKEQLERQLNHRNALLTHTLDNTAIPFAVLNEQRQVSYQNPAMTQWLLDLPDHQPIHSAADLMALVNHKWEQHWKDTQNQQPGAASKPWQHPLPDSEHLVIVHPCNHSDQISYSLMIETNPAAQTLDYQLEERVRLLEDLVSQLAHINGAGTQHNTDSLHHPAPMSEPANQQAQGNNANDFDAQDNGSTGKEAKKEGSAELPFNEQQPQHNGNNISSLETPPSHPADQHQSDQRAYPQNDSTDPALIARHNLVEGTRLALRLWEKYTGKSKAELAEESNLWRVYIDGGTLKTRTLDKYLNEKSLPKRPRWRSVIKTLDYVGQHCTLQPSERDRLEELTQQIEKDQLS